MAPQAHGYPEPLEHQAPHGAPANPHNPPLSGVPLIASSFLVSQSSAIGRFFYGNTGWSKNLQAIKALHEYSPTCIPNVVPKPAAEPVNASEVSLLLSEEDYRKPSTRVNSAQTKRFRSVLDYHEAYRSGKTTPSAVAEALLPLIRRDVPNPTAHSVAFISSVPEIVLKAARESTVRWRTGKPLGILDGVPIAMKDDIELRGYIRTMGLKEPLDPESKDTSWCIEKLEEQGAIMLGKCNMHQIGMDTTNNNPHQGTPLNPYNKEFYTGGSTGGGAYAVAAGLVPFVQGSDAGGSIRIPSCFCGLYGLKPTHNRISIRPTLNAAPSTAVFGPLAASMADLEVAYRLMATPDAADPISKLFQAPTRPTDRRKILGIHRKWFDEADDLVKDLCNKAISWLEKTKGYQIVDITIPHLHAGQGAHALTTLAEVFTLLGDRQSQKQLSYPNRVLMTLSSHTPSSDFLAAQKLRTLLNQHLAHLWQQHPGMLIVTPTVAYAGWRIENGELAYGMSNGNKTIRTMKYIYLANFCGLPSLQGPVGYSPDKIPVGLVANGEWGTDDELVEFGFDLEEFLNSEDGGGRSMPENFVDVLADIISKDEPHTSNGVHATEKKSVA